jgi:hypothetical protein
MRTIRLRGTSETTRETCVELCAPFDCEGRGVTQLVHRMRRCAVQAYKWLVDRVKDTSTCHIYDHERTKRTRLEASRGCVLDRAGGQFLVAMIRYHENAHTTRKILRAREPSLDLEGRQSRWQGVNTFCRHFAVVF